MAVRPLNKNILFIFVDTAVGKEKLFQDSTRSGIILSGFNISEQDRCRWGKIVAVGDKVTDPDLVAGKFALIKPRKWTTSVTYDGVDIWKTDEDQVLAISDDFINAY